MQFPQPITLPESVSGFSYYFSLEASSEAIARAFGYDFARQRTTLPVQNEGIEWSTGLAARMERLLSLVDLTNETARREILIAPLITELAAQLQVQLRIEYPLNATPQLRGKVDYFLYSTTGLLVVEAKQEDVTHGFSQLTAELIALDKILGDGDGPALLYGGLTIGRLWQFGILDRTAKRIIEDLNQFTVPDDVPKLAAVLVAILADDRNP